MVVIAPNDFFKAKRIIDYDEEVSRDLIEKGRIAADKAFKDKFSG